MAGGEPTARLLNLDGKVFAHEGFDCCALDDLRGIGKSPTCSRIHSNTSGKGSPKRC